ncbi:MAG: zinc metalloprotease HtpX [Candidatus Omnitrophica bacterium]|nr:zinc metalloprotease HtpX [Candidatus Omnitrophota bacterium]
MNYFKTGLLLVALTVLLVGIGHLIGGAQGATTAFILALVMNLGAYWFSDKLVLAMYRAKPLSEAEAPQVYRVVRDISTRSRMPMPKLYWIPTATPNAFATGRGPKHASVAVTSGLLEIMDEEELKGVLAHELSHVQNRDTLTMTVAAAMAGAIMLLRDWFFWFGGRRSDREENRNSGLIQMALFVLLVVIVPIAVMIIQALISQSREYGADATGARLAGTPQGLADALEKLRQATRDHPLPNANPATAHLFIVNPLSAGTVASWFSTHPPIEERIRRLRRMHL